MWKWISIIIVLYLAVALTQAIYRSPTDNAYPELKANGDDFLWMIVE